MDLDKYLTEVFGEKVMDKKFKNFDIVLILENIN